MKKVHMSRLLVQLTQLLLKQEQKSIEIKFSYTFTLSPSKIIFPLHKTLFYMVLHRSTTTNIGSL